MEQKNFQINGRIVKRRLMMEAQAQGGAEVRRLHILYFLSRNGHNEHPHLIRINHFSKNGVRLRDIKRWLGELRGKEMPESFAWSYKRTYKRGYVWQDILDDDLITPISDNEYVLKGSEISSNNHNLGFSTDFSRIATQNEQISKQESANDMEIASSKEISESFGSSKTQSSATDSSQSFGSEASTLTDNSVENRSNQEEAMLNEKKKRKTNKLEIINAKTSSIRQTAATSDKKPHHRKSNSGATFRNFISCGGVDTHDSVITSKRYRPFLKTCSSNSPDGVRDPVREKKGGLRQPRAAYSWPLYGPLCSQCGKTFKPEKLQSHMNSCKGVKALAKGSNSATQNVSKISTTASRNEESVSAFLLTQF